MRELWSGTKSLKSKNQKSRLRKKLPRKNKNAHAVYPGMDVSILWDY